MEGSRGALPSVSVAIVFEAGEDWCLCVKNEELSTPMIPGEGQCNFLGSLSMRSRPFKFKCMNVVGVAPGGGSLPISRGARGEATGSRHRDPFGQGKTDRSRCRALAAAGARKLR